jgi:hypothetical protein
MLLMTVNIQQPAVLQQLRFDSIRYYEQVRVIYDMPQRTTWAILLDWCSYSCCPRTTIARDLQHDLKTWGLTGGVGFNTFAQFFTIKEDSTLIVQPGSTSLLLFRPLMYSSVRLH